MVVSFGIKSLSKDKSFGVKLKDLQGAIDPKRFVGRAPEQVDEFLRDVITPLFAGEKAKSERLKVPSARSPLSQTGTCGAMFLSSTIQARISADP